MSVGTAVGRLTCQMTPFVRELTSKVVSCTLAPPPPQLKKKEKQPQAKDTNSSASPASPQSAVDSNTANAANRDEGVYHIVLSDSVLFPEGGGQPCDHGTLKVIRTGEEIPVHNVQRNVDQCVYYLNTSLEVGEEVHVEVDWVRRFDHMQQHTAQHLVTGVCESLLGLKTMSWSLSFPTTYIQLATTKKIDFADIQRVEDLCNEHIRNALPVTVTLYEKRSDLSDARQRRIPADVVGPIRGVLIGDGVDFCACCGTHLDSLVQMQCVKICFQEIKGDMLRVHFMAGNRVFSYFSKMYENEIELLKDFSCLQSELVEKAARRGRELADVTKIAKKAGKELSQLYAREIVKQLEDVKPAETDQSTQKDHTEEGQVNGKKEKDLPFIWSHEDLDIDGIGVIADAVKSMRPVSLLYCGKKKEGAFVVIGSNEKLVKHLAALVIENAGAKGGGNPARGIRGKCEAIKLKNYVEKKLTNDWLSKSE